MDENTGIVKAYNSTSVQPIEDYSLNLESVKRQVNLIQEIMKNVMINNEHYGKIPGCGDKPALLKAGAEKLAMTFRLAPSYTTRIVDLGNGHREYQIETSLTHIMTGQFLGQGVGSCSTLESKYRFRVGEVIPTGKPVPQNYWDSRDINLIGGKGFSAKKVEGKWEIVRQGEKVENDNPADYFNTCYKMAKKRSLIDAILTATAASDIFTQDIDDSPEIYGGKVVHEAPKEKPKDKPKEQQPSVKGNPSKEDYSQKPKPDDGLPF